MSESSKRMNAYVTQCWYRRRHPGPRQFRPKGSDLGYGIGMAWGHIGLGLLLEKRVQEPKESDLAAVIVLPASAAELILQRGWIGKVRPQE